MLSRKDFIKLTTAASVVGLAGKLQSKTPLKKKAPVVVSTWDFGLAANETAWKVLNSGGSSLDAIVAGVAVPESDPKVNTVGLGGFPDRDGRVTLDACIMDEQINCGSVACLEYIVHPAAVARLVMEKTPHVMLTGEGALRFALEQGFKKENLLTPQAEAAWKEWLKKAEYEPQPNWELNHDTIGMLALDQQSRLAGVCTTSGMAWKMHGRVGDSPIIGAGLYVDGEVGGATCSGLGEEMIRIAASHSVVEAMRSGKSAQAACEAVIKRYYKRRGDKAHGKQVCLLAMDNAGNVGAFSLMPGFVYSITCEGKHEVRKAKFLLDK
ncbi:MAG: N(4)-(beta-N-acetylglucosaminyl)-L-asparaginase [Sphingomonadales bacterium]|nr:N(4)-(beta-N-acetylglucosaminyl)-L-asparaginase [Sphingomonadales bacterium]